jgi:hypothetical protein
VLLAAAAFEHWVDRPAIRLSRGLDTPDALDSVIVWR